jgi:hypothetical protein
MYSMSVPDVAGLADDWVAIGVTVYTATVITCNLKLGLRTRYVGSACCCSEPLVDAEPACLLLVPLLHGWSEMLRLRCELCLPLGPSGTGHG